MDLIRQWNLQPKIRFFYEKLWYAQWTSHKPFHLVIIFGNYCCIPYPDRPIKMSFSDSCRNILYSCRHGCVISLSILFCLHVKLACKTWVAWTEGKGVCSLYLVASVCSPVVFALNLFCAVLLGWTAGSGSGAGDRDGAILASVLNIFMTVEGESWSKWGVLVV